MQFVKSKKTGAGFPREIPPGLTLQKLKPARPIPALSLRVPVTPQNRKVLRDLRQAEMLAWNNALGANT